MSATRVQLLNNLKVYTQAKTIIKQVYELTSSLPNTEKYNLVDQMRRASLSIVANIAESQGRRSRDDRNRFLFMAKGSACELTCLIDVTLELNFIPNAAGEELLSQINELEVRLHNFILRQWDR